MIISKKKMLIIEEKTEELRQRASLNEEYILELSKENEELARKLNELERAYFKLQMDHDDLKMEVEELKKEDSVLIYAKPYVPTNVF